MVLQTDLTTIERLTLLSYYILQDAIELLVKVPKLSIPSVQLLATATVLQTDLIAIERLTLLFYYILQDAIEY